MILMNQLFGFMIFSGKMGFLLKGDILTVKVW